MKKAVIIFTVLAVILSGCQVGNEDFFIQPENAEIVDETNQPFLVDNATAFQGSSIYGGYGVILSSLWLDDFSGTSTLAADCPVSLLGEPPMPNPDPEEYTLYYSISARISGGLRAELQMNGLTLIAFDENDTYMKESSAFIVSSECDQLILSLVRTDASGPSGLTVESLSVNYLYMKD